jgi:hypothetical protein
MALLLALVFGFCYWLTGAAAFQWLAVGFALLWVVAVVFDAIVGD